MVTGFVGAHRVHDIAPATLANDPGFLAGGEERSPHALFAEDPADAQERVVGVLVDGVLDIETEDDIDHLEGLRNHQQGGFSHGE